MAFQCSSNRVLERVPTWGFNSPHHIEGRHSEEPTTQGISTGIIPIRFRSTPRTAPMLRLNGRTKRMESDRPRLQANIPIIRPSFELTGPLFITRHEIC